MAEIKNFSDGWKRRIDKLSSLVETAAERGDAVDILEDIAKLEKEVASDSRYYAEMCDNEVKNALESERNTIEFEKNETEQTKIKEQTKTSKWQIAVSLVVGLFAPVLSVIFERWKENKRHERFLKSADAEDQGHSYITKTDRAIIDEGLKDTSTGTKSGFRFPFFK